MTQVGDAPLRGGGMSDKIQARHRARTAMVYVRQSTLQQVERHQESTRLQYALVERALQFGWGREAVVVIDDDLGRSGASIEGRPGFQRLVAAVGMGEVGLVLGVEMSRLARSCRDWHQLLEICALFDTLIADSDGVYDPASYNDRLLLGLKGTMSEAELHILQARLHEGRRAKARRGALGKAVPMGYVRRPSGEVTFDPDAQAQATIRLVFALFERFGTVGKVLRYFTAHDVRLPVRVRSGAAKDELAWHRANRVSLHNLIVNPTYAGAYVYGRRPTDRRRRQPGRPGTGRLWRRGAEAEVVLPDRLPAYISWAQYQRNQAQLRSNKAAATGVPRAGHALLAGLLSCRRCGLRMAAQYNNNGTTPRYVCGRLASDYGAALCQSLTAAPLDALVTRLVLAALAPAAVEASLRAASELEHERAALDRQWCQRRERAGYEAARARRQFDAVEPENRLVARTLEQHWEQALAEQARIEAEYARLQREQPAALSPAERAAITALSADLPGVWQAATTTQEERQTLVRLLLERVRVEVVADSEQVRVECHWHGGHRTTHRLIRPVARLTQLSTYAALVARARELRHAGQGYAVIAACLNQEGWRPAKRRTTFTAPMVGSLLHPGGAGAARRRLAVVDRHADEWTIRDLAQQLAVPPSTLYSWVQRGRLRSRRVASGGRPRTLVQADAATIAALKAIRATPLPWRRLPPPDLPPIA